ncbi:MAG: hypothetical protein L0229_30970 [Blastocatellia bacterium]|nr:hypothetical protein [Blastocatellia bacterium]
MEATRYTVIGLENGRKRTLVWLDGELIGDDDLKTRFLKAWDSVDHEAYCRKLEEPYQEYWTTYLAEEILQTIFEETLDFEHGIVSTPERLQEWADAWNRHGGNHYYTAEEMRQIEEEENRSQHQGPPYSWKEIEEVLKRRSKPASDPPKDRPKCLECLQPMEWIYFKSSPETWKMLCGRAGWTAICRKCKVWRACRVELMN